MKVAINGFGRIGRPVLKISLENPNVEVVAINDLGELETLAYLLKYDTSYGVYSKDVQIKDGNLVVNGKEIKVFSERDPKKLPWKELGVDVVFECTGIFKDRESASAHLDAGAKRVLISAPTKDKSLKTIVLGVNEKEIMDGDQILSMASCTTNCIAPIMKVLEDKFGIEKSLMTTIHSYTSTQSLIDGPSKKKLREGRAAALNIIPSTTGAAIAAGKTIPALNGIFDGMAFRVPTAVGSVSDVVAVLKKDATEEKINEALEEASKGVMNGVMLVTDEPLVSHDIVGSSYSVIVQKELTKVVGGNMVKIVGWYDNEWGYSTRLVDLAVRLFHK
ncbi:type I glyceraldehyde-3-phosphate dehydrogenase [bacterium]|jgi:glyceraldehyde 3-phosphate dehydrogenase|nr:type I glyceraldehyde-3-phosphate dehydrogenase [bacterium]MBT4251164.1 type I glyceraldehyde-3-phosphate dehydrogenase [bacterium]MBT4598044.1 type I glyceraldehyde-3-phosphate dehydrogenase [bacterium]MBT7992822.1 type I glyceraldehyde-3-phosphate dehydrogenase [bacterium]